MRVVAAGAVLILAGCTFDASVAADASVRCGADTACPPGFRCAPAFGRCVPQGSEDRDAPALVDVTLSQARLARSDTLAVTLTVSEALAAPPELRLAQAGRLRALTADPTAATPPRYAFRYTVGADDAEGSARLLADLLDLAGNQALGLPAGSVTFDFSPPQVVPGSVELQLRPPQGCALQEVAALAPGATAQLTFTLDEVPAAPPAVAVEGTSLELSPTGSRGASFAYLLVNDGGPTAGTFALQVLARDDVGNVGSARLLDGGLRLAFDGVAPPSPPVDAPDRLVYRRAPWGTLDGESRFSVAAAPGTLDEGTRLRVLDPDTFAELGGGPVTDAGAIAPLSRTDRPVVLVSAVDPACNESRPRAVRDVEWYATLAGRTPGSSFPNPHRALLRRWYANQTSTDGAPEPTSAAALARADGQRLVLSSEKSFSPVIGPGPSPRYGAGFVYDEARRELLLVAGGLSNSYTNQTWTLSGTAWAARAATAAPTARWHTQAAYDGERERVVLFGGVTNRGCCNADTVEWDGDAWRLVTPQTSPPGRNNGALVYDAARKVSVLFGGHRGAPPGGGSLYADTWLWDGHDWAQAGVGQPAPRPRQNLGLAYDSARGRVVLFGGMTDAGRSQDTWEWDGARWAEIDAGTTLPSPREGHALAFDPLRGRTVLFGGDGLADTWEYDGARWTERTPDGGSPPGRRFHHLAFDAVAGRVTLFGGITGATQACATGCVADLWDWDGTTWTPRSLPSPAAGPSPRGELSLTYDSDQRRVLLFGGGRPTLNDLWAFDGQRWTPLDGGPVLPPARSFHALVYDEARGALVLQGGATGPNVLVSPETWAYEAGEWRVLAAADAGPGTRTTASATYDGARRAVTIIGGFTGAGNASDVWQLGDAGWALVPSPGLTSSISRPATYDTAREQVQLFDGSALLTWPRGAAGWSRTTPLPAPARSAAALTFDRARGQTILVGGSTTQSVVDDVWAWDGAAWTNLTPPPPRPALRQFSGVVYDPARDATVIFGGLDVGAIGLNDTWEHRLERRFRPAVEAQAVFAAANVEADAGVLELRVRAVAGGHGEGSDGAQLALWREGWFLRGAVNDAPTDGGALLEVLEADPTRLERIFQGTDRLLRVLITSQGSNGARPAEVAVDALELRIRYRRPPE